MTSKHENVATPAADPLQLANDLWNGKVTSANVLLAIGTIRAQHAALQSAPPAPQGEKVYAALPEPVADWVLRGSIATGGGNYGREMKREGVFTADQMHAFADATAALRAAPPAPAAVAVPADLRSLLIRCREFIDTTRVPAYPAGASLADEIDAALAAAPTSPAQQDAQDAARWREHVGKLDALIAYCPTCSQGYAANAEMTRDEVIFECGKTAGRSDARCASGDLEQAAEAVFEADKRMWLSGPTYAALHEDDKQRCRAMARAALAAALAAIRSQEHATQLAGQGERKYISPVRTVADLATNLLLMDQSLPIYGAQYIEHQGRGRAIAVSPTVSRERIKDGRWIGEGDTLNAAVIWTRAEQPAAPIQAQEDARDADMFWVADDPEQSHDTLHDAVVRAFEDGGIQPDGSVEIQRAMSMPNIVVRITSDRPFAFEVLTDEAIAAARAAQGGAA